MATTLVFAVVANVMTSQIAPRFTARATVMLDPRSVQVMTSTDVVSDLTLNSALLDTEASVLRSNLLLEEVITRFTADDLAAIDPRNAVPSLSARIKGQIKSMLGMGAGAPAPVAEVSSLTPEELHMRRMLFALRQSMTVWREGQSYLISVAVETEDAVLSTRLADEIVQVYIDRQVEDRSSVARGANVFLTARVETMREALTKAESAVEDFRSTQLTELGLSAETITQQMLELSTQLSLARAELATAEARYQQIQSVIEADGIETAAELLSSPFITSLREQMSELKRDDAILANTFGPEHPERKQLQSSIDLITADLSSEVRQIVATLRNDVDVANIRANSLGESLAELETRSSDLSRASLELRQLEREAEAERSSYEDTLERLNETRSIEQFQRADARIVERAILPGAPSAPRVKLFTALGGSVGFMFGLILVFVLAVTGRGFNRSRQIEEATGLSVLASLPVGRWQNTRGMLLSMHRDPFQVFAERLRQLRATLGLQNDDAGARVVALASALPGEGKTTTTIALAHLESRAKRRCLVLDFDLRASRLASQLKYQAPGDLAAYLRGECALEDAIHHVPEGGFDLITVKRPEPQFADEASEDDLRQLIETLRAEYDLVLVDAPPVLLVADGIRVAQLVDTVLLLVRQGVTRQRAVVETANRLSDLGVPLDGCVMTMVDTKGEQSEYGTMVGYAYGKS